MFAVGSLLPMFHLRQLNVFSSWFLDYTTVDAFATQVSFDKDHEISV